MHPLGDSGELGESFPTMCYHIHSSAGFRTQTWSIFSRVFLHIGLGVAVDFVPDAPAQDYLNIFCQTSEYCKIITFNYYNPGL